MESASNHNDNNNKNSGRDQPTTSPLVITLTESREDDDDSTFTTATCPICFVSNNSLACGPCQHGICQPCMERVLLDSPRHDIHPDDAHLAAPTLGRCPICRAELNLFELRDNKSGEVIYHATKEFHLHESALAGATYVQQRRTLRNPIGDESLHFPQADESEIQLPFLNLEAVHDKLDDGTPLPPRVYFEEGCFFHPSTRTFHGSIVWSKSIDEPTFKGSNRWDFILQFSVDLRFISRGVIVQRREPVAADDAATRFPLDGRWKVTWKLPDDEEMTGSIEVNGNIMICGPFEYILDLRDRRQPRFEWPMDISTAEPAEPQPVVQTAQSGVDLVERPNGPEIGSCIVWTTTDPTYSEIIWERETVGSSRLPPVIIRLGPGGRLYQRIFSPSVGPTTGSLPVHHKQSIWGNIFCQGFKVGLASYHFNPPEEGGSYISYEHYLCGQWPPLDDGSPVPPRVPFHNISTTNEGENRIFRGTIEWSNDYGTSWQGKSKWIYEMHFDSEYSCILSGSVRSVSSTGDGGQEEELMSTYGEDLIYMNAGISDTFRESMVAAQEQSNNNGQSISSSYDWFSRLSRELRQRLILEGASVRTLAMMHHVLVSSLNDDASPIDFNL